MFFRLFLRLVETVDVTGWRTRYTFAKVIRRPRMELTHTVYGAEGVTYIYFTQSAPTEWSSR